MSVQIAKEELEQLVDFQKDLHLTTDIKETIISCFYKTFYKCTRTSLIPMKLEHREDGENIHVYSVNNTFHFLMYTYMRCIAPPIRVKPEYRGRVRVAWPHNLGTNITTNASFKEDDLRYQTWDNYWADIFFQFYQDGGAGKREGHNIGIGNVQCLESWSEYLPQYPINVAQPWFYSMDTALSFPIFYKNSLTKAEHRYKMRLKVADLLRVQYLGSDHKWRNTTTNIHNFLEIGQDERIKIPELWGRYGYIGDREISWFKCMPERTLYIKDIEICDLPNHYKYKQKAEIPLICSNPCLAFFWVAENKDATANNNFSNYTTDVNDLYAGWDPINTTSLYYGTTARLDHMPSDHFSIAEPRKHFPSTPSERGYHGYSYAVKSSSFHADNGMVLKDKNAKLSCEISNGNIYNLAYNSKETDEVNHDIAPAESVSIEKTSSYPVNIEPVPHSKLTPEEPSPNFNLRCRLLVVRKFDITTKDNGSYNFTVR